MDDTLFSLAEDLPDELETAVTSSEKTYNVCDENNSGLLELTDCPQCQVLRQELSKAHNDHNANYNMLKEKIIQTDLLIKRYNAKCQECDSKTKMVDAITQKLEEVKRDCDMMAASLKSALEEGEPLRKAKEKLEKQKENMKKQMLELENKVQALEVTNKQLQSAQEESASRLEKQFNKSKVKELEASLKKSEANAKKYQDELAERKKEIQEYKQKLQKQNNEQKKLQKKIASYEAILIKHDLQYAVISDDVIKDTFQSTFISHQLTADVDIPNPDSPVGNLTVEQIFHEMGVFDMEGIVTDISPAISPIPPSPAENIDPEDVDSLHSSDVSSTSVDSDIESVADLLEDQLLSPQNDDRQCQGNNKAQILCRQLSVDDGFENESDDIDDLPFSHFENQDDSKDKSEENHGITQEMNDDLPQAMSHVTAQTEESQCITAESTNAMNDSDQLTEVVQVIKEGNDIFKESGSSTKESDNTRGLKDICSGGSNHPIDKNIILSEAKDYEIQEVSNGIKQDESAAERTVVHNVLTAHENTGNQETIPFSECNTSAIDSPSNNAPRQDDTKPSVYLQTFEGSTSNKQCSWRQPTTRARSSSVDQISVPLPQAKRIKRYSEGDSRYIKQPLNLDELLHVSLSLDKHKHCLGASDSASDRLAEAGISGSGDSKKDSPDVPAAERYQQISDQDSFYSSTKSCTPESSKDSLPLDRNDHCPRRDDSSHDVSRAETFSFSAEEQVPNGDKSSAQSVREVCASTTDLKKMCNGSTTTSPCGDGKTCDIVIANSRSSVTAERGDSSVCRETHPALPKQSSTGFEVLASEDLFSDSSALCSPSSDSQSLLKEHRPWAFPAPNRTLSPKQRSPVRFMIGDNALIPSHLQQLVNKDEETDDDIVIKAAKATQFSDVKEDDMESVSSLSMSLVAELPSPISPLSDLGSSGEFSVELEKKEDSNEMEFATIKNNDSVEIVATSFFGSEKETASNVEMKKYAKQRSTSQNVHLEAGVQPKTCAVKRKRNAEDLNEVSADQVMAGSSLVDASGVELPSKKRKNNTVWNYQSTDDKPTDQVPVFIITKKHRKVIEREINLLLNDVTMTTQGAVDKLHSLNIPLKGVVEVVIKQILTSSADMLSDWHERCLSNAVDTSTPWLSDNEHTFLKLIRNIDDLQTGVMSFLISRLHTTLFSPNKQVPAPASAALSRMYVALCRLTGQLERCRVFAYDVVYMKLNLYSAVITAVAGIWPEVLYRQETAMSPILTVLQYVILVKTFQAQKSRHKMMTDILCKLCNWKKPSGDRDSLVNQLLTQLSSALTSRPDEVFECERALDLLACHEDWAWANDVLVCRHLWPVLQSWSSQKDDKPSEKFAQSVLRLLGYVMSHCPADKADIARKTMIMYKTLLQQPSGQVSREIQLITIRSLIRLAPYDPECCTSCLQTWIMDANRGQSTDKNTRLLIEECLKHYKL